MDKFYNITPFEVSDAFALNDFMMANESRFQRYLPKTLDQNRSAALAAEYVLRKQIEIEKKETITYKIEERSTKNLVGIVILKKIDFNQKQGEIAYGIDASFEGKGITSHAVHHMSNFAFETLGLETLQIIAHKTNIGSCRVAEKNGFSWKKTLKNEFIPDNDLPQDMELFEKYRHE
ncbi:GNAT family N-acetyltransferase [Cochleicola gelatinilyticus]|uniref:N-acetyltransferase domain-containing protein n=1 Tax=Cochleicola gelatinilyticus TaxID=1763537 RepID=A0A167IZC0_9FLAO|nr:GNAT family N-acetyltransferase [Cochleicola gelatinilyticus]OAB80164.1 hypothetical protein ULVI_05355 [Cochleicola gelatinilyticus]